MGTEAFATGPLVLFALALLVVLDSALRMLAGRLVSPDLLPASVRHRAEVGVRVCPKLLFGAGLVAALAACWLLIS